MKTLIFLILFMLSFSLYGQPFAGRTKHKPVKTMKAAKVKKIQQGKNLYFRDSAGVYKNNLKNRTVAKVRKVIKKI